MVMDECTRRIGETPATTAGVAESAPLIDAFREAANRFRRTFECARDRAFGGLLVGMEIKDVSELTVEQRHEILQKVAEWLFQ